MADHDIFSRLYDKEYEINIIVDLENMEFIEILDAFDSNILRLEGLKDPKSQILLQIC